MEMKVESGGETKVHTDGIEGSAGQEKGADFDNESEGGQQDGNENGDDDDEDKMETEPTDEFTSDNESGNDEEGENDDANEVNSQSDDTDDTDGEYIDVDDAESDSSWDEESSAERNKKKTSTWRSSDVRDKGKGKARASGPPAPTQAELNSAAEEAARQRGLFQKYDRRSYTDLARARTQSGLLSRMFHPDPELFPPDHPYRWSRSTQDILAHTRVPTPNGGIGAGAPGQHAQQLPQQGVPQRPPHPPSGIASAMARHAAAPPPGLQP